MITSKKILVAEDNTVLGDVIRFNLQRAGFDVTLARDGDKASELLAEQPFDILITDYEMPGLNGEELCEFARNTLQLSALKIVMCTAKGYELKREHLQAQFNIECFLHKPFSMRDLIKLLESLDLSLLPQ
jgi:two-component system alkaline phosphatase synthesis response regulator PhoP